MDNKFVEDILLETFSFYEWQNIERVLISLDAKDLVLIESLTLDELKEAIANLVKKNQLTHKEENGESHYMRCTPPKSVARKIKDFLK